VSNKADFLTAMYLLKRWGCSEIECKKIIGVAELDLQKDNLNELDSYQLEKVMHIIRMDELLKRTFMNEENIRNFMRLENQNDFFEGRRPLDILLSGGVKGFEEVVSRLEILAMGLW